MNPIKSPQEMIFEEAGVPHYAPGGQVISSGAAQLFKQLSKKLSSVLGRAPTPEELRQLEQEVQALAKPTSTMEGANLARVAKQEPYANMLADQEGRVYKPGVDPQTGRMTNPTPAQREYLPYEQAFDPRDEFQTYALTGRTNKGTRLREAGEIPQQASLTRAEQHSPSIEEIADHLQALGVPHDYTGMGASIYGNRPSFGAGTLTKQQKAELEAWREQARAAGIPETAITANPAKLGTNYRYLDEERNLGLAGPEASMGGYAQGGGVMKYLGPGLGALGAAPAAIAAGEHAMAGKYIPATASAAEAAATFLPLPLAAMYLGMAPSELGDSSLEGWRRQEALRKQKERK